MLQKKKKKVWQVESQSYKYFTKYEGRKLNEETIVNAIESFFLSEGHLRTNVVEQFLQKLNELKKIMEEVEYQYRFYSSSLLLVYDGIQSLPTSSSIHNNDNNANNNNNNNNNNTNDNNNDNNNANNANNKNDNNNVQSDNEIEQVTLKMVDFAHAYQFKEGDENDDGYLFGLSNFISILNRIVEKHSTTSSTSSSSSFYLTTTNSIINSTSSKSRQQKLTDLTTNC